MPKIDFQPHSEPSGGIDFQSHDTGQPSALEAGLRGGLQGVTANLEDEIIGGLGAGGSAIANLDPSLEHLKQKYQQYRDLERAKNQAAEKSHPSIYHGTDLAGAVAQGFLMPELGLAGPITKGMSLGEKIAQGAKIGAGAGALAGFGGSNADLTEGNTPGVASDTLKGAATGYLAGGALQGGVEGVKGLLGAGGRVVSNILNRYKPTQIINKATQKGLKGIDLTDISKPLQELEDTAKNLATKTLNSRQSLSKEYDSILSKAEKSGNKADLSEFLDRLEKLKDKYISVKDPEVQNEIKLIDDTIKNYTEGMPKEVETVIPYTKIKQNPRVPSAKEKMQEYIDREYEKNRIMNNELPGTIQESGDGKYITPVFANAQTPELRIGKPDINSPEIPLSYDREPGEFIQKSIERQGGNPELDPQDVFKLQKLIGEKTNKNLNTYDAKAFGKAVDQDLAGEAESAIPGLKDVNSKYSAISTAMDQLGLDLNDSLIKNAKTGVMELNPKALNKIQQFIKSNAEDSLARNKAENTLGLVMDNLDAAGFDTNAIRQQVKNAGENFDLAKDIAGKGLHARLPVVNVKNLAWMGNFLGNQASKVGDSYSKFSSPLISGEAQERATEAVKPVPEALQSFTPSDHSASIDHNSQSGNSTYDTAPGSLEEVSQQLMQIPGMEYKGQALKAALDSGNVNKKNSLLFSLMQNPNTRRLLQKVK